MSVTPKQAGPRPSLPNLLKVRATKWVSRKIPDPLLYRILVRRARLDRHLLLQAGLSVADQKKAALDIGANRGTFTWHLSRRFPRVHAFEPNRELGAFLTRVAPANCTVHRCALSETAGTDSLALALEGGVPIHGRGRILKSDESADARPDDFEIQSIKLETLDGQDLPSIGFIKIDVEGHEEKVLRGGLATIGRDKPVMLIEIEKRHTGKPVGDTLRFVESLGYRGCFFLGDEQLPLSDFDESMQDPGFDAYVNDFLFLPK